MPRNRFEEIQRNKQGTDNPTMAGNEKHEQFKLHPLMNLQKKCLLVTCSTGVNVDEPVKNFKGMSFFKQ